jgi:hypothetical protein
LTIVKLELDHFFMLVGPPAPEADALTALGMIEGTPNDHPGQGTSNRRFFFSDTALELVYVRNAREANEGPGRSLRFPERAGNPGASPFGLVLKADTASADPFPGWRYQPEYFENGQSFLVGSNSDLLAEPLCICLPPMPPPLSSQPRSVEPYDRLSELRIHVPVSRPSPVLEVVSRLERITLKTGSAHLLEIVFNEGKQARARDFRPLMPLVIFW